MLYPIQDSMNVNDVNDKSGKYSDSIRFGELPEAEKFGQHLALVMSSVSLSYHGME
jgi:hypothetical protein